MTAPDCADLLSPRFLASFWLIAGGDDPRTSGAASTIAFEKRVDVAAAAGFAGFGFTDADLAAVRRDSRWSNLTAIRKRLDEAGLDHLELEAVFDWFESGERRTASDRTRDRLFGAAADLRASHVKVLGDFHHAFPPDRMVESFAALCEDARKAGTRIAVEPTPLTNIATPWDALALIETSGATNAGLMLDVWHLGRAGVALDSVSQIPGDLVFGVELDDADAEIRGSLLDDTMDHRRMPGEGALDPARLVAAVHQAGYRLPYGIEVTSIAHRRLLIEEAARHGIETARKTCLRAAQIISEGTVPAN